MKVAIIVAKFARLGPVIVMQNLVNCLSESNEVKIKVFYFDNVVDPSMVFSVPVEQISRFHFPFSEYDIIHTNGIRSDFFAWIYRKKIKFHISTIHNFVFDDLSYTYNKLISFIFGKIWLTLWKSSDKLVCISETMKRYYETWFEKSKMEVIHNGIPESNFPNQLDDDVIEVINSFKSNGLKVIGSAGIQTKIKGTEQVFYLLEKERELAFVLIGDGMELDNLRRLAAKLNISDRIYFCGFKAHAVNYYKNFDYFIMSSRSEGFGLSLIEAVQQKVPVICSEIPVFNELFDNSEVTFFKLDDLNSLSEALIEASSKESKKTD